MRIPVMLAINGQQTYADQEPDAIQLVTEGYLEQKDGGWEISYQETDLTGMDGVTTTFRLEEGKICLHRSGRLNSQMVFQIGVTHDSLYQMEFGTMMISVCASVVDWDLSPAGGRVDLVYGMVDPRVRVNK